MIPTDKLNKEKLEEGHSNMKPPQQKKNTIKQKSNDSDGKDESGNRAILQTIILRWKQIQYIFKSQNGDYILVEFKTEKQKSKMIYYVGKLLSSTAFYFH